MSAVETDEGVDEELPEVDATARGVGETDGVDVDEGAKKDDADEEDPDEEDADEEGAKEEDPDDEDVDELDAEEDDATVNELIA